MTHTATTDTTLGTYAASDTSAYARRRRWSSNALFFFMLVMTFIWLLPFFSALLTSVRTQDEISLNGFWRIPTALTVDNFVEAWERGRVSRYLGNSFLITLPSLAATLFLSSLSAFALARYRFRGNTALYFMFVAGTMLPFQILLLPVFRLANSLHIYNTHWSLIIIHTAFQMGFCTFVLRNFMRTVPTDILDAARVDGCSEFRIYWRSFWYRTTR
jgi:multiple sugar transport system permease protein